MRHLLLYESGPDDMQDGIGTWRHLAKYNNILDNPYLKTNSYHMLKQRSRWSISK